MNGLRILRFVFLLLLIAPLMAVADEPVAWVDLGYISIEHGLSLLDGGDGLNDAAVVGESECRRNVIEGDFPSYYLYFDHNPGSIRLRRPVYVTVEYFDNGFGFFRIEYDSADLEAPERGAYKDGATELLLDSRKWRKVVFELPDARFDGRQKLEADFRLFCSGQLALRKVSIELEHSTEYDLQPQLQRQRVAASVGKLSPPPGVQVVFSGVEAASMRESAQVLADMRLLAPMMKALGATSVESYVRWDFVEPSRGHWDWSLYDGIVSILKENGLKWNPFIIAGPAYATPAWFKESNDSVFAKCLEHNTDSKVQSIWNPRLPQAVDRFVAEFASHYGDDRIIESILVGVSGDTGEAIYPVTSGGSDSAAQGQYHTHSGYWCGDDHARADFSRQMEIEYDSIEALNKAWSTSYQRFDEVEPFIPDASRSARSRLDFLNWYRGRMTKWSSYWLTSVRKQFPSTDVYLCTGGDGQPAHGSDFSAQCKVSAKLDAGVRIVNEASDYALNFAVTRLIGAAGRHYGAYYVFESAGAVTSDGIAARLFNAITSKASGIHVYYHTILTQPGGISAWSKGYRWLGADAVRPKIAVLYPQTALSLKWGGFYEKVMLLRDIVDFDLVDESMIRDGALRRYGVLVIINGSVIEREDIERILAWLKAGGTAVACDFGGFSTVEGDSSLYSDMFDTASSRSPAVKEVGSGLTIYVADGWNGDRKPIAGLAQALETLDNRVRSNLVPDGVVDGIYMSDFSGYLLAYNSTDKDVERDVQIGIGRRKKVVLPAHAVTRIEE